MTEEYIKTNTLVFHENLLKQNSLNFIYVRSKVRWTESASHLEKIMSLCKYYFRHRNLMVT
jgi:hypothetical protein